jgi:hypothetical protein
MSAARTAKSNPLPTSVYYKPPTPAPLPADYTEFLASLNATERELMEIAGRELKSSFFVQWCRAYQAWTKAKAARAKVDTAVAVTVAGAVTGTVIT